MKYRTTNLVGNLEFTTDPESFLKKLSEENELAEQVMFRIVQTITMQAMSCMEFEEEHPDSRFHEVIRYSQELASYGFIGEASTIMDTLRSRILEFYNDEAVWFDNNAAKMLWYDHKPITSSKKEKLKIYLETWQFSQGNMITATWCFDGCQNDLKPIWHEVAFSYEELRSYVEQVHGLSGTTDTSDHEGNHVQTTINVPLAVFIQENMDHFVKSYIQDGKEYVNL